MQEDRCNLGTVDGSATGTKGEQEKTDYVGCTIITDAVLVWVEALNQRHNVERLTSLQH